MAIRKQRSGQRDLLQRAKEVLFLRNPDIEIRGTIYTREINKIKKELKNQMQRESD
jgi:hypothetical protein